MSQGDVALHTLRQRIQRRAHTERILGQLSFANELSKAEGGAYDELVTNAAGLLLEKLENDGCIDQKAAAAAEEILSPLSAKAKEYTMHCVAHAHIDMNWMWRYDETVSVALDTFRTMLDLMREYPQFTFSQSQASTYQIVAEYGPEGMLEEIKQRIREGRWEVTASTWVEGDKNTPNGESMARHLLYTRQYLSELLELNGETLQIDYEPDTFGHSKNVPEILSKGGVKYYYHVRGSMDPALCWWTSPSGARVLSYRDPAGYGGYIDCECASHLPGICKSLGVDSLLKVYGVGDHGGGPSRRDIKRLTEMQSWPVYPNVVFSTYGAFYRDIETRFSDILPVRDTEMNSIFTGCYTSQTRIKMANRIGEATLGEAELFASAAALHAGYRYPVKKFADAWERILFNQFHDILTGSGTRDTREYAMGQFQTSMAAANTEKAGAMRAIAAKIDTSRFESDDTDPHFNADGAGVGNGINEFSISQVGRGQGSTRVFHLFNSAPAERTQMTELTIWDWPGEDVALIEVCDDQGNRIPYQLLGHGVSDYWGHNFAKVLIEATVPACGYATYIIRRSKDTFAVNRFGEAGCYHEASDPDWQRVAVPYEYVLENEYLRAQFDLQSGDLVSLIDKESGKEMLSSPAGFRIIDEDPDRGMASWRVGRYMNIIKPENVHLKLNGNIGDRLRQTITIRSNFGRSNMTVNVWLDEHSRSLGFDVSCDWHELAQPGARIPQLNFIAPLSYEASGYKFDVPSGIIVRESVDLDQPGNSFIAAVPAVKGTSLMLTSDTKYGFRGFENAISADLIRASYEPDPCPEYGMHRFKIALCLADADDDQALIGASYALWHPINSLSSPAHKGEWPTAGSFLSLTEGNAVLQSVKLAEDGSGDLIVRLYAISGKTDAAIALRSAPKAASVVDIHENPMDGTVKISGSTVTVSIDRENVTTLRISF